MVAFQGVFVCTDDWFGFRFFFHIVTIFYRQTQSLHYWQSVFCQYKCQSTFHEHDSFINKRLQKCVTSLSRIIPGLFLPPPNKLCIHLCLFVCLFICEQYYVKTTKPICTKLNGGGKNHLNFGQIWEFF